MWPTKYWKSVRRVGGSASNSRSYTKPRSNSWKAGQTSAASFRIYGSARFINSILIRLFLIVSLIAVIYVIFFSKNHLTSIIQNRLFNVQREFVIQFKNVYLPFRMDLPDPERNNPGCAPSTKLLILIMTRVDGFKAREGVRESWLKEAVNGTVTKFIIADSKASDKGQKKEEEKKAAADLALLEKKLEMEQLRHKDLVFLHGVEDSYANLHLKWLAALHWQQAFCSQAKWIMKTDDDTVVHLPRLNHWIDQKFQKELLSNEASYFGWIIDGVGPIRELNHKWYVSEKDYPGKSYPAYMQGATYVASNAAISKVLPHTPEVAGFNMDDVLFTGILAELANVTRVDHKEMFRVGNGLDKKESCENGEPHVTALYGAGSLEEFKQIYAKLTSVKCDAPAAAEGAAAAEKKPAA